MGAPITKEGYERLSAELERLKSVERPAIIDAIKTARAHGDLKENAEYHSAKEKQGFIEARIRLLEGLLSSADIIEPATLGADGKCIFGAYVELSNEENEVFNYRLVGEFEADIEKNLLSVVSPLGKALIGKYAGDSVTVRIPDGEMEYELLNVQYEAASG